jgi:hypothetical protein
MDPDTIVERCGSLVEAEVAGELFGLDIERGSCFGFNATATRIWELLDTPRTFASLCEALIAEHDVDRPTCLSETAAALQTMASDRLVAFRAP